MKIKRIIVGELETNCYLLFKNKQCLIIDPGADENSINKEIKNNEVKGILITHHHFDHVGALIPLQRKYQCLVYDYSNLKEKNYQIGDFNFDVIYTEGHTNDSVSYYFDKKYLFTGDFLFKGTIGRYDLPTGDFDMLMNNLEKIKQFPLMTRIYPGHGESTNLETELRTNMYLRD